MTLVVSMLVIVWSPVMHGNTCPVLPRDIPDRGLSPPLQIHLVFYPFVTKGLTFLSDSFDSMRVILVVRTIHDIPRGCLRDADLITQDGTLEPDD
ncbi:hypothetical protein BDM02DRAFT_3119343 [Thelephora ganbajun]|uniref:Uncharacterized protein n=1 Tax=Thelephora ganbajun TaxID=370292 RepID=A0ACB6Z9E1_THEGA|nr:hypothetical protein BDM02DRAFT_3119343 [Thelephora ganbajun]